MSDPVTRPAHTALPDMIARRESPEHMADAFRCVDMLTEWYVNGEDDSVASDYALNGLLRAFIDWEFERGTQARTNAFLARLATRAKEQP